jgi:hypothetical protein
MEYKFLLKTGKHFNALATSEDELLDNPEYFKPVNIWLTRDANNFPFAVDDLITASYGDDGASATFKVVRRLVKVGRALTVTFVVESKDAYRKLNQISRD